MSTHSVKHNLSPIQEGIKCVGIGKKGSKPVPPELSQKILNDFKAGKVLEAQKGAFFGALLNKGVTEEELLLGDVLPSGSLSDPVTLMEALSPDAPETIKSLCSKLLNKKTLNEKEAHSIGKFLLTDTQNNAARGLIVSILRVRYETPEEYHGIWKALQETIEDPFKTPVGAGEPIIQIAEPFDGVDHSNLITPLLADYLQTLKYRCITLVGRNSGPKKGNNLLDIIKKLNGTFLKDNAQLSGAKPDMGWYVNQTELNSSLDHWVEIRREIVKRPCWATLEKFLNPCSARVIITSAFHLPYTEKMAQIAEMAGFPGSIVVRNGIEGTIAFSLLRETKVLCSARQKDGTYKRQEFSFNPQEDFGITVAKEEVLTDPSLEDNAKLISEFLVQGRSSNELLNLRVGLTTKAMATALDWIKENIKE